MTTRDGMRSRALWAIGTSLALHAGALLWVMRPATPSLPPSASASSATRVVLFDVATRLGSGMESVHAAQGAGMETGRPFGRDAAPPADARASHAAAARLVPTAEGKSKAARLAEAPPEASPAAARGASVAPIEASAGEVAPTGATLAAEVPGAVSGRVPGATPDGSPGALPGGTSGAASPGVAPGVGASAAASAGSARGAAEARGGGAAPAVALLHRRLESAVRRCYPPAASRFRVKGEVVLSFCLDAAGAATSVAPVTSSGSALLDRAATDCVLPGALPVPDAAGCYRVPVVFGAP